MSAFDVYVQAAFHGGTIPGGPTFTVVHDAETPLVAGYADSITDFFRRGPAAGTSAHAMVDPVKATKMLPDNVVAYAAGPTANTFGWHLEQAGYASFTPDQWLTADGRAQMQRVGACLREVHDTWGIPKRWMTDDQLRAAARGDRTSGGIATHQQISRVFPHDTTHQDPETNYPRDLLLEVLLAGTPTRLVQEDTNMTVIQPGGEAVIIKGVGHTQLRVACDFDPQALRIAFDTKGGFAPWPGSGPDYTIWIAPSKVSILTLPPECTMISVAHRGVGDGGKNPRPVTVDTCPAS